MNLTDKNVVVLLLSCPDKAGLVSRIAHFIFERGGNILDLDEHVITAESIFSIRVAWQMDTFTIAPEDLDEAIRPMAKEFNANYKLYFSKVVPNVALFVSKYDHCLNDLLWRYKSGELFCNMVLIISNHPDLQPLADFYNIPFYLFPVSKENKLELESAELNLLNENNIDTIVLARYMQILSDKFVQNYPF